jgi:hypothetical protein
MLNDIVAPLGTSPCKGVKEAEEEEEEEEDWRKRRKKKRRKRKTMKLLRWVHALVLQRITNC